MRRSALRKDFLREISHTRSRFLSILILVALSVAFLSGLRATAPDMKHTGDDYLDALHLADVQALSTLGLTDGDLEALLATGAFETGEAAWALDAYAAAHGTELVTKVYSLSERGVNDVLLREGRLPAADDECVVEEGLLAQLDAAVGDAIALTPADAYADALRYERFTIVGTIRSPVYLSIERGASTLGSGSVKAYLYLPRSAFALDYYTVLWLRVRGAAEMTAFYEEYDDSVSELLDELKPLAAERAQLRYDDIVEEANAKLDDARRALDDARAEADEELGKAERELSDARRKLDDGWVEYRDGERTLARETAEAEQKLADARAELRDALRELLDGEIGYEDGLKEYQEGLAEYEEGLADYEKGLAEYEDGEAQYAEGLTAFRDGRAALADAFDELTAAEAELAEGKARLDAAEELFDTLAQLLFGMSGDELFESLRDGSMSEDEVNERLDFARAALDGVIEHGEELLDALPDKERLREIVDSLPDVPGLQELVEALPDQSRLRELLDEARARRGELDGIDAAYLLDAMQQLADARTEYEAGASRIAEGWAEYEDGVRALDEAEEELADARAELDEAKAQLDDAKAQLDDAKAQLDDAQTELDDGRRALDDGWTAYREGLADALRDLNDGEAEYADGMAEYLDGKREAEEKLADGEEKLLDARRRLSEIEHGEWYLFSRSYNPGYTGFGQDADRMGNLASVFPMIFFLVAALVCLTTMTRMVEEQRIQIGSLKALGYSRFAISRKYLGYGMLPSLIGSALGLAIGYTLFPAMIFTAYQIMYQMPNIELRAYPEISAFSVLAAVACTTLSTLWACLATLRESPAALMRPRAPKAGKRVLLEYIRPLWRRMKFIHKVTARNLFRYQKRFWMTVIGIGGCTALIIAGFGLRSSLMFTMSRQFDELFHYTAQVTMLDSILPEDRAAVERFIASDGRVTAAVPCAMSSATAVSGRYSTSVYVETMEADALPQAIELYDAHGGGTIAMGDEGVYIDQKLGELLGVGTGDEFFIDGDERANVTVAGVFEHYTAHFVYMTPAYYERAFGAAAETNGYLLTLTSDEPEFCDAVFEELMRHGSVTATRMSDTRDTYLHSMERIDFVVVIVILAAAALAMVVLYNLSNINITERLRELATIKLLGFYDGEVSAYVYRENVVLTVFGTALGILMGHWLHVWLVRSVEIDLMMFGRETDPKSYLYAAVLTFFFSFLVNLLAHFKMKKIDMVESLKSAE